MASVRGKDTGPELLVRRLAHAMGLRFRLHRSDLPGKPDLVLPKYQLVVFVHGCFWHRHEGCSRSTLPVARREFWTRKFESTVARDARQISLLESLGWTVLVIWECELKDIGSVQQRIASATKG